MYQCAELLLSFASTGWPNKFWMEISKIRQIEGRSGRSALLSQNIFTNFSSFVILMAFLLNSCPKLVGTPGIAFLSINHENKIFRSWENGINQVVPPVLPPSRTTTGPPRQSSKESSSSTSSSAGPSTPKRELPPAPPKSRGAPPPLPGRPAGPPPSLPSRPQGGPPPPLPKR